MTPKKAEFFSELLSYVFGEIETHSTEEVYKILVMNFTSFLIIVPKYSKHSVKSTIKDKDVGKINIGPCFNDLIKKKFTQENGLKLFSKKLNGEAASQDVQRAANQFQIMDFVANIKPREADMSSIKALVSQIESVVTMPVVISLVQPIKPPIFLNVKCAITDNTLNYYNAYYNNFLLFRAENHAAFLTEDVTFEKLMTFFDEELIKSNLNNKMTMNLFNIYNPLSNGYYQFPDEISEEDKQFQVALSKPDFSFFNEYLKEVATTVQIYDKNENPEFKAIEVFKGQEISRKRILDITQSTWK